MSEHQSKKAVYGGFYGAATGLAFAVGSAGYNGYNMAKAHVLLPWASFAVLSVILTLLGWLVGWISVKAGRTGISAIAWFLFGILAATLATMIPLWLIPQFVQAQIPAWAKLLTFGWQENHALLLGFSIGIAAIGFMILGLLQGPLIEGAYYSVSVGQLFVVLFVAMLLGGGIGGVIDTLINSPVRNSVMALEQVVSYQLDHRGQDISKEVSRSLRLSALRNVKDSLNDNWQMAIADVDLAYSETHILLFTGEKTSLCYIFGDQVSNCMIQQTP